MKISYSFIILLFFGLIIAGCDKVEQETSTKKNPEITDPTLAAKSPIEMKRSTPHDSHKPKEIDFETRKLADIVFDSRSKNDPFTSPSAMHQLMAAWNPQGYSKEDLLSMLGAPNISVGDVMWYTFDNGRGGWEWSFEIKNGVIVNVVKNSLE